MEVKNEVNLMSPLTWAYVGDAVYELHIRNHLIETMQAKPNKLHKEAVGYVKAKAQAEILNRIHRWSNRRRKRYCKKDKKHAGIIMCLKMQI